MRQLNSSTESSIMFLSHILCLMRTLLECYIHQHDNLFLWISLKSLIAWRSSFGHCQILFDVQVLFVNEPYIKCTTEYACWIVFPKDHYFVVIFSKHALVITYNFQLDQNVTWQHPRRKQITPNKSIDSPFYGVQRDCVHTYRKILAMRTRRPAEESVHSVEWEDI